MIRFKDDVVSLFNKLIPNGVWEHDAQDGNGDSHLKAGISALRKPFPLRTANGLSTWQNIFLCEFDGPRSTRKIVVTIPSILNILIEPIEFFLILRMSLIKALIFR
jgi:thiamine phosphate synthase YjbQ (UPF0047 family)